MRHKYTYNLHTIANFNSQYFWACWALYFSSLIVQSCY